MLSIFHLLTWKGESCNSTNQRLANDNYKKKFPFHVESFLLLTKDQRPKTKEQRGGNYTYTNHGRELDLKRLLIRQRHILNIQGVTAWSASSQPTLCKDTLLDRNRDLRG